MKYRIPFNRPSFTGNEQLYIAAAINNGNISGDGPFTRKCEKLLEEQLGQPRVLLTTSCTHALEIAAILLDIKPGDEVIVPSYTFVSTANAFVLRGARPIFVDIRPDTLNLDERLLEGKITPRTKAIIPVHYGGVGCEMDAIMSLADQKGIAVVEDNAHGLFGKYKDRYLGTFGSLATQSFHETKNFTCGEGGALLINNESLLERAEIIREKGTNRKKYFRGQIDKYSWVDIGSSYVMSDVLAAFLLSQLEAKSQIQAKREILWKRYFAALRDWAVANDVLLPTIPAGIQQSYHLFYLILPSLEIRQRLIQRLSQQGILSVFHYVPLHLSIMGKTFGGKEGDHPIAEAISDRLLRLPFFNSLSADEQDEVIDTILGFEF